MATTKLTLFLLLFSIVLDFITGIGANYIEAKNEKTSINKKKYLIESSKLRFSVLKFITYGLATLIAYCIEYIFRIEPFETYLSIQKITFTCIIISFCCTIEIYSIFFENIKRMGFDIILKTKRIISEIWKLYKILKGEKQND